MNTKKTKRDRRRKKIRTKIIGTSKRPRLSVFRSNAGLNVQIINDSTGRTLVSANSREIKKQTKSKNGLTGKTGQAFELGKKIANKAKENKITNVVFDRGGYQYHGRIKAIAEGAREGGLNL